MVANVSDIAGLAGGTPAGESGESADGFLQELLGIAGMLSQMNVPTVPASGVASDAAIDEVAGMSAPAQREVPAWLSASLGDLAVMPGDDAGTPAVVADSIAMPQQLAAPLLGSASADMPATVATTLGSSDAASNAQAPSLPHAKAMPASTTLTPAAQLASHTPSTQVFTDTPSPEATVAAAADGGDTSNATAPATAPAYDIGEMLASMRRFEREPARVPKAAAQPAPMQAMQDSNAAHGGAVTTNESVQAAPTIDLLAETEFSFEDSDITTADAATSTPTGRDINTAVTNAPVPTVSSSDEIVAPRTLHARLGSPEWKDQLGAQLNWMVENGKHSASLKLTPEHLGPVEVRIDLNQNQTSVWFSAANADTRTALEQALPRLRELMSEQGMSLNDAGVFREPPREQQRNATGNEASSLGFHDAHAEPSVTERRSVGLLDTYA